MTGYRFLHGVTEATREALRSIAFTRRFEPGEPIFHYGDNAREMLAIDSGRLKLWRSSSAGNPLVVSYSYPGDLVGAVSVVQRKPYLANATALTQVVATAWSASRWRALMASDPALSANIAGELAKRAGGLADRMEELAAASVEERVARALIRLEEALTDAESGRPEPLRISQSEIAGLAQTTVPTVSRVIGRWRAAGVVTSSRGSLTILDLAALQAIAGGKA